jgi:hypothetical protein
MEFAKTDSSILVVSDCPLGGLAGLFSDDDCRRMIRCPAREACATLGCLRSVGLIIVSMDAVTPDQVVSITDRAREALVPVLMI